ncbi:MAG: PSD1 and planctomycete cytochrome C domain-containing protein [Prosthecobacter sp.]
MRRWLSALLASPLLSLGAEVPDFARDIQPIFKAHCLKCHGPDGQNGTVRYDQKASAFGQADSGKRPIVAGSTDQSELLRRITSTHKDEQMPPKGARLGPSEIDLLRRWITAGAIWPESATPVAAAKPTTNHWAFQPIHEPKLPEVKDKSWPRNPIDHFIHAKREAAGLVPAPDATPEVLMRRLSYDLTGLPPSAALLEMTGTVQREKSDVRSEKSSEHLTSDVSPLTLALNSLLASASYGERWGRHWMDWVRYADTAGDNSDYPIPQAYLYRNYIIQSLNDDVPYDRFITEQIAGDLLPAASQEQRNRHVIATGYLAMARRFGSLVERYPWHLTIEDTIDNLGRTIMGLTLSCARCHDHKFDPVSARDYYGIYGIFASTRYPFPGLELFKTQRDFVPLIPPHEAADKLRPFAKDTAKLTAELDRQLAECQAKALDNAVRDRTATIDEQRKMKDDLDRMLRRARDAGENLADHLKKTPVIPAAYAVQDARPVNARLQMKGEPDRLGGEVPRKFIDILGGQTLPDDAQKGSGRLELARWITDSKNPLTARVIVNRVWQRHFGRGLVPSTNDFGLRGEKPTHPELLDWLALDFMRHGWSLKHLHRLIVTSRTYQMACADTPDNLASNPSNTLYWKFNRQRLDAESLRDTLLFISGALDPKPQTEPHPIPPSSKWGYTQHHPFKDDYPSNKRSVYLMTKRLTAKPYLQTFDGPDPNVCTGTRDTSVTALQALYFVNDEFLHEQAALFAKQLVQQHSNDDQRLESAFRAALARTPTRDERTLMLQHLQTVRGQSKDDTAAWASLTRSLFRLNEFLYLD